jgi:hypothetical protein
MTLISACKLGLNDDLIGTYQLAYIQQDFGPDANKEIKVESERTVEFKPNGIIISADSQLCSMSQETEKKDIDPSKPVSTGVYDVKNKTINITPCGPILGAVRYEHTGQEVILYFSCNNVCKQRFKKVK